MLNQALYWSFFEIVFYCLKRDTIGIYLIWTAVERPFLLEVQDSKTWSSSPYLDFDIFIFFKASTVKKFILISRQKDKNKLGYYIWGTDCNSNSWAVSSVLQFTLWTSQYRRRWSDINRNWCWSSYRSRCPCWGTLTWSSWCIPWSFFKDSIDRIFYRLRRLTFLLRGNCYSRNSLKKARRNSLIRIF